MDGEAAVAEAEATGEGWTIEAMLDVRARTRRAVDRIAGRVRPGMGEEEARAAAKDVLTAEGLRRGWHPVIVRCGPHTARHEKEPGEGDVTVRDDDLFLVDIGPVFAGIEGDAGDTFVLGDDPEHHRARADVHAVWSEVRAAWFDEGCTGAALYARARHAADRRGWVLNEGLSGHRLSEFPHRAHHPGPLADLAGTPNANLWVLEISLVRPDGALGAFYEDLLLEDQSFPPA